MLSSNLILVVNLVVLGYVSSQDPPTAKLGNGDLRGHHKTSYGGRTFAAFEGIPYAKPPVGKLRFAEPQPAEPWTGTWDATLVHTCIQLNWFTKTMDGSEDCLYINVYVPREQPVPNENLDVIVYIHGGAFMLGDPDFGGPEFLVDRDLVFVNLNYRLNVFGFMSTEDDVVPGNNGMKDIVLALKWVQENIAKFGGNPNSVTVSGVSAGGAAVHLLYLSPLSKGLFHRGISHSGVATASWVTQKAPLRRTRAIADTVGCNRTSTKELVECLRQRPARQLAENVHKLQVLPGFPLAVFGPTIENESSAAFLTDHPIKLLEAGKTQDLPWIAAVCSGEGILGFSMILRVLEQVETNWNKLAPTLLDFDVTVPDSEQALISRQIKEHYFGTKSLSPETIPQIIKLFGDRYFVLEFGRSVHLQSKANKAPVYTYLYDYKSTLAIETFRKMFKTDLNFGVSHAEDGQLLYSTAFKGMPLLVGNLTEADESIKEFLVDAVTSFAKSGKPEVKGVSWEPVSSTEDFRYLLMKGPGNARMIQENDILSSADFWKSLPLNEEDKFSST